MTAPKVIWVDPIIAADWDNNVGCGLIHYNRADAPELVALVNAVRESSAQIAYLHEWLGESTGSGNAVMARNNAALAAWEALK